MDGPILANMKKQNHELIKILISKVEEIIKRINIIEVRLCALEAQPKKPEEAKPTKGGWIFT
eukprot:SAG11_NODE_4239_length_1993_cov_1.817318_2_plen_62_part_00